MLTHQMPSFKKSINIKKNNNNLPVFLLVQVEVEDAAEEVSVKVVEFVVVVVAVAISVAAVAVAVEDAYDAFLFYAQVYSHCYCYPLLHDYLFPSETRKYYQKKSVYFYVNIHLCKKQTRNNNNMF